jgi:hypothetical protein
MGVPAGDVEKGNDGKLNPFLELTYKKSFQARKSLCKDVLNATQLKREANTRSVQT